MSYKSRALNWTDQLYTRQSGRRKGAKSMGLSTHVLDTMNGCPAAGMAVSLYATQGEQAQLIKSLVLNADGRSEGPLLETSQLQQGTYKLVFNVKDYFAARGVALPQPNFLDKVSLDFGVADPAQHYHVPLLVSPWSYSTYRGS
jgi:5-hydroxyisourate hydrolase